MYYIVENLIHLPNKNHFIQFLLYNVLYNAYEGIKMSPLNIIAQSKLDLSHNGAKEKHENLLRHGSGSKTKEIFYIFVLFCFFQISSIRRCTFMELQNTFNKLITPSHI